ncbi:MAG TPA: cytochrome P450 [Solirubrobacteraceae bacterium]|jgi:cytochrome P450
MTLVSELELPNLDYNDPQLRGPRFHAAMRELREQSWLATGPFGYVVLDREASEMFLRTRSAIFPGMKIAEIFGVTEGPLYEEMRRNILHINGADHTRLRSLVNPALAPRAVERYRPLARGLLEELFAASASRAGKCEFVDDFAKPYPSQMIAAVMGAPLTDAPRLHHWSNWIQRQFDAASMMEEREGIELAVVEFYEYAGELVRTRREDPGDDLISKLIAAEEEGENGENGKLSDVECVNLILNVLIGGVDTTQSQLAHAVRLFAEHPEQWQLLAERPELAAAAVEEVLRVEPITPFTARITTEELTFRDVTFPADTVVMVCAFTGNRDLGDGAGTSGWDDFDITAERGKARALTFGAGVHYCLGANLARVELQEALAYLPSRMPELTLDGEPVYESIMGIYGLSALPVRFTAQ